MSTNNVAVAVNVVQTVTNAAVSTITVYNEVHGPIVSAAQGPQGIQGINAATSVGGLIDVNLTGLTDGALLVYDQVSTQWKSTTVLEKQALECGQY